MRRSTLLTLPLLATVAAPLLVAQQLTPRDAFWSASDLVSVSANPAAKAKPVRASQPRPAATPVRPRGSEHVAPQLVAENGYGEQPHLVRTSLKTKQLGLRYSLLLRQRDGSYEEASPDATFHDGDHVRLSVMSNEPGFLYVIQQGSSGSWSPLFPVPNSSVDSNRIEPGRVYQVPDGSLAFRFDEHPGKDTLFVVLSRTPIRDLDGALQRLKRSSATSTETPAPQPAPAGQLLEASNHIPDSIVQSLASRDLTLVSEQKVDNAGTGDASGEKAVYVVAKQDAEAPAHEVVTRIVLNHQ